MARQMGKWMDHVLGPSFSKYSPDEAWVPAINLCEDESGYCIVVELAGVEAEEIELNVQNGKLTLSGHRSVPGSDEVHGSGAHIRHMEIDHGRFSRTIELPCDVDVDRIEANYKGGFLRIHMPKRL